MSESFVKKSRFGHDVQSQSHSRIVSRILGGSTLLTAAALSGTAALEPGEASAQSPSPQYNFASSGAGSGFAWPGQGGITIQGDTLNETSGGCSGTEANVFNVSAATANWVNDGKMTMTAMSVYEPCDSNTNDWASLAEDIINYLYTNDYAASCNYWQGMLMDEEFSGYGFSLSAIESMNSSIQSYFNARFDACPYHDPAIWGEVFFNADSGYTSSTYLSYKSDSGYIAGAPQIYTAAMAGIVNGDTYDTTALVTWDSTSAYPSEASATGALTGSPPCLSAADLSCAYWANWFIPS